MTTYSSCIVLPPCSWHQVSRGSKLFIDVIRSLSRVSKRVSRVHLPFQSLPFLLPLSTSPFFKTPVCIIPDFRHENRAELRACLLSVSPPPLPSPFFSLVDCEFSSCPSRTGPNWTRPTDPGTTGFHVHDDTRGHLQPLELLLATIIALPFFASTWQSTGPPSPFRLGR